MRALSWHISCRRTCQRGSQSIGTKKRKNDKSNWGCPAQDKGNLNVARARPGNPTPAGRTFSFLISHPPNKSSTTSLFPFLLPTSSSCLYQFSHILTFSTVRPRLRTCARWLTGTWRATDRTQRRLTWWIREEEAQTTDTKVKKNDFRLIVPEIEGAKNQRICYRITIILLGNFLMPIVDTTETFPILWKELMKRMKKSVNCVTICVVIGSFNQKTFWWVSVDFIK